MVADVAVCVNTVGIAGITKFLLLYYFVDYHESWLL